MNLVIRKKFILVICFLMVFSVFTGCGKKEDTEKELSSESTKDIADEKDKNEEKTFTYWSADTTAGQLDDKYNSDVSRKIKELTGVTLRKEFAVGDPREKLSFMAASGEYPDFIYALEYSNIIVDAGGFIKLDGLIDEYGPNIKKLYGDDLARLRWSKEDPSIYFLGLPEIGKVKFEPESGFEIQHAALKELGYPKMETLKDYEEAIKKYVEANPEINGKPTIGLSLLADDWRIKISLTNPGVFSTGGADDGEWFYDKEKERAILHVTRPEEKEYFRWLNHMNDIGLLDKESFIQKYDQYQSKIAEGRVVAITDSKWQYSAAEQSLVAAGMSDRTYAMFPLVIEEGVVNKDFRPTGYSGGYGIGISTSCKDPVAAIKFLDWMCTDEAQILARWGIEGQHYDVIDGKRTFKPEVFKAWTEDPSFATETGIGIYSWPWPGYGQGAIDKKGDYYHPTFKDTIIDAYNESEKETLAHYGATMWKDLYPSEEDIEKSEYGVLWQINIPSDTEASVIMAKYDETTAKRIPEAILASPDEFDEIWDDYQQELVDVGIHKLEDEFNKLLQDKLNLWSN
ncbi:ABC transporter substrate-binding protein [Vallitalea longa]|uniref:ABC transporter substrate-binding protein n=1 Tax=Vallitalea longa TaxID=2936439 RepID=A0A9W5YFH1_9FIRM|nr:ABC transporter substrate-binding protein [Vallitalea longa]GKX31796.1 ABC transporter substrate-binding protein [Vallitalea longa]